MRHLVFALTLVIAATSVHGWGAMFNRWGGGTHGKGGSRYNPFTSYDTSGQYYNMLTKSEQGVEEPSSRVLEAPIQDS